MRADAPDRFLVVIQSPDDFSNQAAQELWQIDGDGKATKLGSFPALPPEVKVLLEQTSRLDAHGGLFQLAGGMDPTYGIMVRRDIQGGSAVVYDEATNPLVKAPGAVLITGP